MSEKKNYTVDIEISFQVDFYDEEEKPTEEDIREYLKEMLKLGNFRDYVILGDFEIGTTKEWED